MTRSRRPRPTLAQHGRQRGGAGDAERGRHAAAARRAREPVHVPAYPVKVRDVSGAGDTVVAVLAVMLALGADFEVGDARGQCRGVGRGRQARHRDGHRRGAARAHPAGGDARDRGEDRVRLARSRRAARRMARAGSAHRLHQWLFRPPASRPYPGAGAGARGLRPAGGRPQQRRLGAAAARARTVRCRTSRRAPRCWPRSKRSISSSCSSEDTPLELIKRVRPKVLVKGGDYRREQVVGRELVEAHGGEVMLVDLVPGHSAPPRHRRARSRCAQAARKR